MAKNSAHKLSLLKEKKSKKESSHASSVNEWHQRKHKTHYYRANALRLINTIASVLESEAEVDGTLASSRYLPPLTAKEQLKVIYYEDEELEDYEYEEVSGDDPDEPEILN